MQVDFTVKPGETKEAYRERMAREMCKYEEARRKDIKRGIVPVVMDVDDFGYLLPGYDDLLLLKQHFPAFKITAFTIPLPKEFYHTENAKQFTFEKYKKWAEIVNEHDWIEVAIHGFSHVHNEMECTYDRAIETIDAFENLFKEIGLEYSKIFKAPYWQYSWDALVALRDRGYIVGIDRNHQRPVPDGLQTYVYNWSFEEPLPAGPVIKGHGHFTGRNQNNIREVIGNIFHQLPSTTQFMNITDYQLKYKNGK